jgi:D-amino-acid dehydrogenase
MVRTHDVLVLGAGVVGVSTAIHLQKLGKSVGLIDRRGPGEETSYGNSGAIEASSVLPYPFPKLSQVIDIARDRDSSARTDLKYLAQVLPFVLRLRRETTPARREAGARALRPLLQRVVAEHKDLLGPADGMKYLREKGWIRIFKTEAAYNADALTRTLAREFGIDFETLTPQDMVAIEPHLKPAYARAMWMKNTATVTSPGNVTKAYANLFTRDGGAFYRGEGTSLRQDVSGGWTVTTHDGEVTAPEVVVALGPWSMDVLRPLGYRFPLGIKRGYHQHFKAEGNATLTRAIVDGSAGVVIAPMDQGYRITTGAEFTDRDAPPNPTQIQRVLPRARELFALGEPVETEAWMGRRPCFADSLPIVDRAYNHKGLWLNFGHGHLGFTLGPVTGHLLAQVMTQTTPLCDPAPYRATRF